MSELDQVSAAIGSLKAQTETQNAQLSAIFVKMDHIMTAMSDRSNTTSTRITQLEADNKAMAKDIEALTKAITELSNAISTAKMRGLKFLVYILLAAGAGGGGSAAFFSGIKGIFPG